MIMEAINISIQDNIAYLEINRPEALNAINRAVMDSLHDFFTKYKDDFTIKGVMLFGSGEKAFAAGADIKEFAELSESQGSLLSKKGQDVFFEIEHFHAPVIAVINGFCLGGGCELAMSCHMRIATEKSKFGQPEVNLGLIPGYGATQRLVHLIGKTKALELLMTADLIDASQALSLGLINHVCVSMEEAKEKANGIFQKISSKAPIAIKNIISCVNDSFKENKDGFETEHKLFGKCLATEDAKEGALAFIEKRKASFSGK
ncbi:MAG: hypothetical protein RLZZ546_1511 [Bacteroidota bacterium]|jgi:enoyl-CoA hydratase